MIFWKMDSTKEDNETGLGRVASILTLPHLFKIILIPVPFKKLNETGPGEVGMRNSHTHPI